MNYVAISDILILNTSVVTIMKSIRAFRKKKGYTQEILARKAGIARSYLCEIEKGYKIPSIPILEKLANALGVSVVELLQEEQKEVI